MTSGNQTLKISNGNVTINGGAQSVSGGTHVVMAGGTLTEGSGVTFNTATLGGFGTVAANLARTGGTDTITASAGTLDLTGTFGAGLAAAIDSTKVSDLKFDNTATSNTAIAISNANQSLEIGGSGNLTIGAAESITNGTIKLDGGSLTDTAGLTIGAGASLTGFGTITTGTTGPTDFESTGTVTATGGALEFKTATNQGAAGTAYHITDTPGSILRFDSAVGTAGLTPTVTFDSSGTDLGTLDLTHTTLGSFHATVNKFVVGDTIDVAGADSTTLDGTGTILTVKNAGGTSLGSITLGQSYTGKNFFVNSSTGSITTDDPCYAAGTRILTATGERTSKACCRATSPSPCRATTPPVKLTLRPGGPAPELVAGGGIQVGVEPERGAGADLQWRTECEIKVIALLRGIEAVARHVAVVDPLGGNPVGKVPVNGDDGFAGESGHWRCFLEITELYRPSTVKSQSKPFDRLY